MAQTLLRFNLESTDEKLTPRTGVAILGEYLKGINLENLCNTNLPLAKHPNGYAPYLHRHASLGTDGVNKINRQFFKRFLKSLKYEELILDIDATFIEAHKNTAKWSYKGAPGYMCRERSEEVLLGCQWLGILTVPM